jgi:hypothetical protein
MASQSRSPIDATMALPLSEDEAKAGGNSGSEEELN